MSEIPTPSPKDPSEGYLSLDAVFARAKEADLVLKRERYTDINDARQRALTYAQELDAAAKESGLMPLPVTITGDDIFNPVVGIDNDGDMLLTYTRVHSENIIDRPSVDGSFLGFTVEVTRVDDVDGFGDKWQPGVSYQVQVGEFVSLPMMYGTLTARGYASTSELEFLQDRQKRDAEEALARLFSVDDLISADFISTLNERLTTDPLHYKVIRKIARDVRTYLDKNSDLSAQHRDAILDLVQARLRIYYDEPFNLQAVSSLTPIVFAESYLINDEIHASIKVKDVIYGPHYYVEDGKPVIHGTFNSLFITTDYEKDNGEVVTIMIPMEKINLLQPTR